MSRESSLKPMMFLVALAAILRIGVVVCFNGQPLQIWDERDYDALAQNLTSYGEFSFTPGQPTAMRPPLYPVVMAAIYSVFGEGCHQAVRYVQVILSLGTLVIVCSLGRRLFSDRVGLYAAGAFALYPSFIFYCGLLLTETLFTFLLCLFLWLAAQAVSRTSLTLLMLGGLVLGLAALTRSILWLFPVPFVIILIWFWPGNLASRLRAAIVFSVAFAAALAPWSLRNTQLEKTFIAVDTMGGRNLMMGNYEHTPETRAWDAISIQGEQSWHSVLKAKNPEAQGMTQGQIDKLAMREGVLFALNHPWLTIQRDIVKFVAFWGLERELIAGATQGFWGNWPKGAILLLALAVFGSYILMMMLGVFGLFMTHGRDRFLMVLVLLATGFICLLHTLSFGHSRYHLPIMPVVMLFAANAWVRRLEIWSRRGRGGFLLAVLACGLMLAAWALEAVLQDWERICRLLSL